MSQFLVLILLVSGVLTATCAKRRDVESQVDAAPTAKPVASIIPQRIKDFKAYLPKVDDEQVTQIFQDPDTFWYDKTSLPHVYQDSVLPYLGVRYNTAGLAAASIAQGNMIFDKLGFKYPFATAFGTDFTKDVYLLDFMALPKVDGKRLNVAYWVEGTRWRWTFPIGTVMGEVLMIKAPAGLKQSYYAFEVRTRRRYKGGWIPNIYRPFPTATSLEGALLSKNADWESKPNVKKVIEHLRSTDTLTPRKITPTRPYQVAFKSLEGFLDFLPDFGDPALVADLLSSSPFLSVEGKVWKAKGKQETYAASTKAAFSVVPSNYDGGLIQVNEVSCNRCHQDAARPIGEFNEFTQLYGEIWGEDHIFTWHLFDENKGKLEMGLDGTFVNNRVLNGALFSVGFLEALDAKKHTNQHYARLNHR
jgi:hypothetical protein